MFISNYNPHILVLTTKKKTPYNKSWVDHIQQIYLSKCIKLLDFQSYINKINSSQYTNVQNIVKVNITFGKLIPKHVLRGSFFRQIYIKEPGLNNWLVRRKNMDRWSHPSALHQPRYSRPPSDSPPTGWISKKQIVVYYHN